MKRLVLCAALAGCSFVPVAATPGDGSGMRDARGGDGARAIDAPPDAFDPLCFGSGAFYLCLSAMPAGAQTLPGTVDTTSCSGTGFQTAMVGSKPVCVFAGDSVDVGNANVGGSVPLVLVANGDINLTAYLDASSVTGIGDGPGANDASCTKNTNDGSNSASGAGGGAGGSFGTAGAPGAAGGGAIGGTPGTAAMAPVVQLRGGCQGGKGGQGSGNQATGGAGGGAVMLVARGTIHLDGTIDTSGAGGSGGNAGKGGAGGGGSGGMVVLHGTVAATASAIVFANGGGGGGGAGQNTDGNPGIDAMMWNVAAPGGATGTGGTSPGGAGAFLATPAVKPATASNGGGGGGGGVGVIRLLGGAQLAGAHVSPAAS